MKKLFGKFAGLLAGIMLLSAIPVSAVAETAKAAAGIGKTASTGTKVVFKDPQLEKIIRGIIKKPTGDIYSKDVSAITSITAADANRFKSSRIRQLDGIESLTGLTALELPCNLIADLRPLGKLAKLQTLDLSFNCIEDVTALKSLPELAKVNLSYNRITDVTPLGALAKLKTLNISWNLVRDITPLEKLNKLAIFYASFNLISRVDALKKMTTLLYIDLDENPIADISPAKKIRYQGSSSYNAIEKAGKAAQEVIRKIITPQMTDLEKEKAIYDYIIQNVKFNDNEFSVSYFNAGELYSKLSLGGLNAALVSKNALECQYALAMRVLGGLAGLDVLYVIGSRDGNPIHTWNLVKIKGQYTHVDIGCEQVSGVPRRFGYQYLNKYENEFLTKSHIWDMEYFPATNNPTINPVNFYSETFKINSEIPVTRDYLIGVMVGASYQRDGADTGREYGGAAVYPANAAGTSLRILIPKEEMPIEEGIVTGGARYILYELNGYGVINDLADKEFESRSGSDGETTGNTAVGPRTLKANETTYMTLLGKGSNGTSYHRVEREAFYTSFEFKPVSFSLKSEGTMGISHKETPDKVEYLDLYSITNTSDITLPPYSAVYLPPEYSNQPLGKEYDVWGRLPLVENHTGETVTVKAGQAAHGLLNTYKKGTGIELVLIAYDGDFTDKVAYLNRTEQMLMIKKQVVIPVLPK